jgi:uncharacterized membrane protein YraQ (UPF0718 family)
MHWDLRQRGLQVAMEPSATTRHENFSRLIPSMQLRLCVGQLFAGSRARGWPIWRRLAFAAASPAIPVVRAWRTWHHLGRVPAARRRPGLLTVVVALLAIDGLGECLGYLFGAGDQSHRLSELAHNRPRFMTEIDRNATS